MASRHRGRSLVRRWLPAAALFLVACLRAAPVLAAEQPAQLLFTPTSYALSAPGPDGTGGDAPAAEGAPALADTDPRTRVLDNSIEPYKHIAALTMTLSNGRTGRCTGVILAPDLVMTAAHCLVTDGVAIRSISAAAGRNGPGSAETVGVGTEFDVPAEWLRTGGTAEAAEITTGVFDFGLVYLSGRPFEALAPFPTVGAHPNSYFASGPRLETAGYPSDKPSGTLWREATTKPPITNVGTRLIFDAIAKPGQSGSPIFAGEADSRMIVGILVSAGEGVTAGRKVTAQMIDALSRWCAVRGCGFRSAVLTSNPPATSAVAGAYACTSRPDCPVATLVKPGQPLFVSLRITEPTTQLDVWVYYAGELEGRLRWRPPVPELGPFFVDTPVEAAAKVGTYQFFVVHGDDYIGSFTVTVQSERGIFRSILPIAARN